MSLPSPKPNPLMYPDRCDLKRRSSWTEDQAGGVADTDGDFVEADLAVPCAYDVIRDDPVAAAIRRDGKQVDIRVGFPRDVKLADGDIVLELDGNGNRTGRGLVVVMYRRLGRVRLRHYEAICSAWQRISP